MFFPFFIIKRETINNQPKVISGEMYTTEWWRVKAQLESKHQTAARLNGLINSNVVEKIVVSSNEIVRFKPTDKYSVNDVVEKIKSKIY